MKLGFIKCLLIIVINIISIILKMVMILNYRNRICKIKNDLFSYIENMYCSYIAISIFNKMDSLNHPTYYYRQSKLLG